MADSDFVPPKKTYLDDIEVFDAALGGVVPAWKSLIYHGAVMKQRMDAMARADSAPKHPVKDEQQPPRTVADDRADAKRREDAEMNTILEKLDCVERRMEALESRKRANDALLALEAAEHRKKPGR